MLLVLKNNTHTSLVSDKFISYAFGSFPTRCHPNPLLNLFVPECPPFLSLPRPRPNCRREETWTLFPLFKVTRLVNGVAVLVGGVDLSTSLPFHPSLSNCFLPKTSTHHPTQTPLFSLHPHVALNPCSSNSLCLAWFGKTAWSLFSWQEETYLFFHFL